MDLTKPKQMIEVKKEKDGSFNIVSTTEQKTTMRDVDATLAQIELKLNQLNAQKEHVLGIKAQMEVADK